MLITLARIVRTFGNNGALYIETDYDLKPEDFLGRKFFIAPPLIEINQITVKKALVKGKRLILFFKEINSLDKAEKLVGRFLQIEAKEVEKLKNRNQKTIAGFKVYLSNGSFVGKIEEVLRYPAQEILDILTVDNRRILIPNVYVYVLSIDEKERKVVVDADEFRRNWG